MRRVIAVLVAVLAVASLWYVQAPPRGANAYRERAAMTLETVRSQVQTARVWEQSLDRDDAFRASAAIGFEEAEHDANKAAAKFEGYDPPPGTEDVRSDVSTLATETTTALAELRIAAHDGDWSAVHERARALEPLAVRLERQAAATRP